MSNIRQHRTAKAADIWVLLRPETIYKGTLLGATCMLEVAAYVKHCPSCQVQKPASSGPIGLLQPLEVPPCPWHTVTTDYMTGLPKTAKGNTAIVVFVDKLTK